VLVALCVALPLWSGTGSLGRAWDLSMGTIVAFILLLQRFVGPMRNLGEDWQTVQSALSGVERIVQVLPVPAETVQRAGDASPPWLSSKRPAGTGERVHKGDRDAYSSKARSDAH
jgi:ABC-type bacteriocin/lantibiotic exporter with double-glycine peptidase domain